MRKGMLSLAMITAFVITSVAAAAQTPVATPKSTPSDANTAKWECGKLDAYRKKALGVLFDIDGYQDLLAVTSADDFSTIRPSQARSASIAADEWATALEKMKAVPLAAVEYHKALITSLSALSGMLLSYANGGVFAMLPYADTMKNVNAELDTAGNLGSSRCPVEWEKVFGEPTSTSTPQISITPAPVAVT